MTRPDKREEWRQQWREKYAHLYRLAQEGMRGYREVER